MHDRSATPGDGAPRDHRFDTTPESAFDRITRLAQITLGAEIAGLSLLTEDTHYFKSLQGCPDAPRICPGRPIDETICKITGELRRCLAISDMRADERTSGLPSVRNLGYVGYLGAPVRDRWGDVFAVLCVITRAPRVWSARDVEVIVSLAATAETEYSLRDRLAASRSAHAEALRLAEARKAILATCNHELRTPLNGILGGASLLAERLQRREDLALVTMIEQAGRLLLSHVEKAMQIDALEGEPASSRAAPFSAPALVRSLAEMLRGEAESRGLELRIDVPETLPALSAERVRVLQILVNLVENAIKYTSAGSVSVSACRAGEAIEFRVSDTGCGIPAEDHERVFERLVRGSGAHVPHRPGCGLGLAICREVASSIGARLEIERSEPGKGSVFLLSLPAPSAAPVDAPENETAEARTLPSLGIAAAE